MNLVPETATDLHAVPELPVTLAAETELKQGVLQRLGSIATTAGNHIAEAAKPTRRKLALLGIMASVGGVTDTSLARVPSAQPTAHQGAMEVIHNPVQYEGHPLSCPDPNVIRWAGKFIATCTSDYGQHNPLPKGGMGKYPAAFPIYESNNLKNWTFKSYIFPPGHHPAQAMAPKGDWTGGRYWADEIHHFGNQNEVYFGAKMNQGTIDWINRNYHENLKPNTFGLFVAWSKNLLGGNWQSRLLHFPGQYNTVQGNTPDFTPADAKAAPETQTNSTLANSQEIKGGVIDPTVAQDPRTGQLIMAYAKQPNQIFVSELTPDGLYMQNYVRLAIGAGLPWECQANPRGDGCVTEGPVLNWNKQDGAMEMYYNAGSTWYGSYKIGMAASTDPLHKWTKYPYPILQSGNGLIGPGIGGQPFTGPDGNRYLAFHVQTRISHDSQARYLAFGKLHYDTSKQFLIPDVTPAQSIDAQDARSQHSTSVSVPQVGSGEPGRSLVIGG